MCRWPARTRTGYWGAWLITGGVVGAVVLVGRLGVAAPAIVGDPVSASVALDEDEEFGPRVREIRWDLWHLRLHFPHRRERPLRSVWIERTGQPPRRLTFPPEIGRDVADFSHDVDPAALDGCAIEGRSTNVVEAWAVGGFKVYRICWRLAGSGPPAFPLVLVVERPESTHWTAMMTYLDPGPADGGEAVGIEDGGHGTIRVWWWQRAQRNVMARHVWEVRPGAHGPNAVRLRPRYLYLTKDGYPTTYAPTAREAVHWGREEAAWRLLSANRMGGIATAYADSPRRSVAESDVLLPHAGVRQPFGWMREVYRVRLHGGNDWIPCAEALRLVRQGGWNVVLRRTRPGLVLAGYVIEEKKGFPHLRRSGRR